jgi:two-component system sensor histidine kinase/response regulator
MFEKFEMREQPRARAMGLGVAVLAVAVSLLMRAYVLQPVMGAKAVYLTFCPAVMIAAYFGGFGPGLLATVLSAVTVDYLFTEPLYDLWIHTPEDLLAVGFFVLVGTFLSVVCEALHRSRRRVVASERRYAVTLSSIGDAVIATDDQARVTFLNPVAEALTGWSPVDATGQPLSEVFRIVNEETRHPVEDPGAKVLRLGTIVGLANHTVLLARDGREIPIDDSGAPIIGESGGITGVVLVFRDISERKRAEDALREKEERFRSLVQNSSDIISLFDAEGTILYQAPSVERLLGYRPQDRVGRNVFRDPIVHADDLAAKRAFFDAILSRSGAPVTAEFRMLHVDGSLRDIEAVGQNFLHDLGVAGIVANYRDITDRKRAEEALRESEQRWRSLTEALPQLVWTATPDGACDYFSIQWTQHTGVPEDQLLGWQWMETLHPDDREPTRQLWMNSVAGRGPYDVEYRVRRADGEYRWFITRGVPIRDGGGHIFKWFGTCTDITELRQTEEALRESEERFRGTFENAGVGIVHTHPTGPFLRVNEKFCAIVGYPRAELLQKTFEDITHPDDLTISFGSLGTLLRGESAVVGHEKRYLRKDGSPVWVELFTTLQRDAAGQPAYAIAVVQDISERRQLDAELRRAKEMAESANRAKDEFLANVSHEIRTPMNAILGMTELILDTPLNEDQRQSLKTVKSAADNLLGIINDLLEFSKIEAGKLELDPGDFALRAVVDDTLRALAVRAHRKGLELICNVQPDVPDALIGDAGRLRQVLLNLVGNAIKFTEAGEVVLNVETVAQGAPENQIRLRFIVRDTGIGIAADKQASIFRAFEQEDTSTTRKYGGTGLGLTIAARLVALMDGEISVDSQPEQGSTFAFTVQFGCKQPSAPAAAARSPIKLRDMRVLIVDDNETNRHILEQWLHGWQMQPLAVGDGLAALDALWHAVSSGHPYPLVLLDARMPDTDGLVLEAKIRQRNDLAATRIILLTSGERIDDMPRIREARLDAHLLKPVEQRELLETICRVVNGAGGEKSVVPAIGAKRADIEAPATAPLNILVAEDSEFNVQHLELLLSRRGHFVKVANNGRDAMTLSRDGEFDLLLLDIHMPHMDGFQVVKAIREREENTSTRLPIIALTARSRAEDREQCLAAGMDDFVSKPIHSADLWAAIDRVVATRQTANQAATAPQDTGLIDKSVLLAACGGDEVILQKICKALREHLPDQMAAVRNALNDRDPVRLRDAAHKLCGMVSAFSTAVANIASSIEDHDRREQLEAAQPLVEQLASMSHELIRQAKGLSLGDLRTEQARAARSS